jgi:Uma2 family endonuclease
MSTLSLPASPAPVPLTPAIPPMPVYRFSVAQYEALGNQGILRPEDRVELIRGWVVPKMTKGEPHSIACGLLIDGLLARVPAGWHLRIQDPATLEDSVPEPDGAVVRGSRRTYLAAHPGGADVGLAVEVAASSLDFDRTTKRTLYAEAGIPFYWIVNLVDTVLEVYSAPSAGDYTAVQTYGPGEEVPLVLAGVEVCRIPVAELLP